MPSPRQKPPRILAFSLFSCFAGGGIGTGHLSQIRGLHPRNLLFLGRILLRVSYEAIPEVPCGGLRPMGREISL